MENFGILLSIPTERCGNGNGIRFWSVHVFPSNVWGIGLFTCKMTLYTYYMRPNYMVYRKAQDFGSVA